MALLPGIGGCTTSSNVLARAGSRCLAAASHAPSSSPVFLLHVNGGGGGGRQAHLLSRKAAGNAVGLLSGRTRRRDLHVVASAATANVTPASPRGVSASDVLWPSAGESEPEFLSFHLLCAWLVWCQRIATVLTSF